MPILIPLLIFAVVYAFFAVCLMQIAQKTGAADSWQAWVPILNLFLMVRIAGKPWWWALLALVPCVGIVFAVMIWMAIAQARGKPSWIGLLILVPFVGIFVLPYLAFSE